MTLVPNKAISTDAKLSALSTNRDSVQSAIQYSDGLGRPLQAIQRRGSPQGHDVIQPSLYDNYGREARKYLPYVDVSTSYGSYRANALSPNVGVNSFYNPGGGTAEGKQTNAVVRTPYPFSQTGFDESPLNEVVEQGAPGASWRIPGTADAASGNHTLRVTTMTNDQTSFNTTNLISNPGSHKVALYIAITNANGSRSLIRANNNATYPSGRLTITITRDDNWQPADGCIGTTEEYKDNEGHIVLRRSYTKFKDATNTELALMISTYYVFDEFGNLAFILPRGINADANSAISSDVINNKGYQYIYDAHHRMIQKKIPGKGWEFMVYNKLDQIVATQDSVQRMKAPQEWTITKYDGIARSVITGIYQHTGSTAGTNRRQDIQNLADATSEQWESRIPGATTGDGYTANSWPQTWTTTLQVNYFDTYTDIPGLPAAYDHHTEAAYAQTTVGLKTATKTLVLYSSDYLWTVPYYNEEDQIVRTISQHYLGGANYLSPYNYDDVTTTYNFLKNPVTIVRKHYAVNAAKNASVLYLTIADSYTYDQMGRKLNTYQQLKDGDNAAQAKIIVAQNAYNEIGQLSSKRLHSINNGASFLQTVNYRYNPRGWLTNINNSSLTADGNLTNTDANDQFGMELYYDGTTTSKPQFNGNIATAKTKTADVNGVAYDALTYDYAYDGGNRLTDAVSTTTAAKDDYYGEHLRYNTMGDITTLGRYEKIGSTRTQIDTLTYTYTNTYRTDRIDDASTYSGPIGFKDSVKSSGEYTYDGNGNQRRELNRGISSIVYNMLNLPQTITKSNGNIIVYVYDAAGQKLRKLFSNGSSVMRTEYVNGIEYDNGTSAISFIQTEEGRARKSGSNYVYEYDLKDHLGNTRVTMTFDPADASQMTPKILQRDDYYAFGYSIQSLSTIAPGSKIEYLYNGKELQEETGYYDYGARFYDPIIARWTSIDPLVDSGQEGISPYGYVYNNPIKNTDPDGRFPDGPGDDPDDDPSLQKGFWRPPTSGEKLTNPIQSTLRNISFHIADALGLNDVDDKLADIKVSPSKPTSNDKVELGAKIFVATLNILTLGGGEEEPIQRNVYTPKIEDPVTGEKVTLKTVKNEAGNTKIDKEARGVAHTQLREDATGNYPQRTTFDSKGRKRSDTHFTTHGEPKKGNPHKHTYYKNGKRAKQNPGA